MIVSPAKAAQPIEMPFGLLIQVDPREHLIDRVHMQIRLNSLCAAVMRPLCRTSGYATWFTAGGAIRIAHYDVIDDGITRKL